MKNNKLKKEDIDYIILNFKDSIVIRDINKFEITKITQKKKMNALEKTRDRRLIWI